ncbi:MAG: UDP-N-acetylmuramoyl-tripeptide--D-alanyl-D-alanine ligase [SAR86 cluster bacterium]|uniref:UDP-N-acetylmuramoyl-tripeptide--D-alanyl-D-alanine ligase n=1 Tax=SAR86 cluster bacterium TaxID=2030880 RepID=A0A520MWN8_9GAMM|nr:MAG: UDP-N-acetylmuramoyl-tripeptide--D-alanyl-D-alanine ligase [SAR86 cluster bacterium]
MKFISSSNDLSVYLDLNIAKGIPIKNISIDTRTIKKDSLFIAIKGDKFDGNDFVQEAFEKGASLAIADNKKFLKIRNKKIVYVKNTIGALKKISENIIKKYGGNVIAITGSNGKTTTTNIIANSLNNTSKTIGNYNNEIGMPLSIINASPKSKNIIIEIGAAKAGDIDYLSRILNPFIGVITNIGNSHLETLKNINGVLKVKSEIVNNIKKGGYLIVPNENKKHLNYWKLIRDDINIYSFGMTKSADFFASDIRVKREGMHFKISSKLIDKDIQIKTSLEGEHNIKNILSSFVTHYCLGNNINNFALKLNSNKIKNVRQIKSKWLKGSTLIDDTYNANPDSSKKSIDLLSKYKKNTILVIGDMLELGKYKKKLHKEVGEYAKANGINIVLGFGELTKETIKAFGKKGIFFDSEESLKSYLIKNITSKDVILIKGSRGMKMERFINV